MEQLKWQCLHFDQLTIHQLYALGVLRQDVFVVEQNCPYLDFDNRDQKCWHVLVTDPNGYLLAYTRLVPLGISYPNDVAIGRVVTSSKARGKGLGRPLMLKSMEYCKELWGKTNIRISAQKHLEQYYNSVGFISTTKEYLEDGIPHIEMYYNY